jgi:hypothetical protein
VPGLQSVEGEEHQRYAGFHIEDARAIEASVVDAAGHGWNSAEGVNGIEVSEYENGLGVRGSREVDLQVVTVLFRAVEVGVSAKLGELLREMSAHAISGGFVVAGGFNCDEFADGFEE